LDEGHTGNGAPSRPPATGSRRRGGQRQDAPTARCKCLPGSVGIEAQACPRAVPEAHAAQPIRVRVHPITGNPELLGKFLGIDQADVRRRGRQHLSEVFCDGVDLVDIEHQETSTACGEQHYLARDPGRET
jgi:hypothetical protein